MRFSGSGITGPLTFSFLLLALLLGAGFAYYQNAKSRGAQLDTQAFRQLREVGDWSVRRLEMLRNVYNKLPTASSTEAFSQTLTNKVRYNRYFTEIDQGKLAVSGLDANCDSQSTQIYCLIKSNGQLLNLVAAKEHDEHQDFCLGENCEYRFTVTLPIRSLLDFTDTNFDVLALAARDGSVMALADQRAGHPESREELSLLNLSALFEGGGEEQDPSHHCALNSSSQAAAAMQSFSGSGKSTLVKLSMYCHKQIGGEIYRIYIQPYRPKLDHVYLPDNWQPFYLVGLKNFRAFNQEKFRVPPTWLLVLFTGLLLLVLALPFLKLFLVGEREPLTRMDVRLTGFALIAIAGLPFVLALSWVSFGSLQQGKDQQAAEVLMQIRDAFAQDARRIINTMHQQMAGFFEGTGQEDDPLASQELYCQQNNSDWLRAPQNQQRRAINCSPVDTDPVSGDRTDYLISRDTRGLFPRDLATFALDRQGRQTGPRYISQDPYSSGFSNLSHRQYFQRALRGQTWPLYQANLISGIQSRFYAGQQPSLYLQRLYNLSDGRKTTQFSMPAPTGWREHAAAAAPAAEQRVIKVLAAGGRLRSLFSPILPAGLSYAILDNSSGDVLYHSNDDRSLTENFLLEVDVGTALLAATEVMRVSTQQAPDQAITPVLLDGRYKNQAVRMQIAPLHADLPLTLVVLYAKAQIQNTILWLGLLVTFIFLLVVLACYLFFGLLLFPTFGARLSWLYPQHGRLEAYPRCSLLILLHLPLWGAGFLLLKEGWLMLFYLLMLVQIWSLLYLVFGLPRYQALRTYRQVVCVYLLVMLSMLMLFYPIFELTTALNVLGLFTYTGLLSGYLLGITDSRWRHEELPLEESETHSHRLPLKQRYTLTFMLVLLPLVLFPIAAVYLSASDYLLTLELEQDQLWYRQQLRTRELSEIELKASVWQRIDAAPGVAEPAAGDRYTPGDRKIAYADQSCIASYGFEHCQWQQGSYQLTPAAVYPITTTSSMIALGERWIRQLFVQLQNLGTPVPLPLFKASQQQPLCQTLEIGASYFTSTHTLRCLHKGIDGDEHAVVLSADSIGMIQNGILDLYPELLVAGVIHLSLLFWLVAIVAQRLLGIDLPPNYRLASWRQVTASTGRGEDPLEVYGRAHAQRFVEQLSPPGSRTLYPRLMAIRTTEASCEATIKLAEKRLGAEAIRIDMSEWIEQQRITLLHNSRLIVIDNLEPICLNAEARLKGLELFEQLESIQGDTPVHVILLVEMSPLYRLSHPEAYPEVDTSELPTESERYRWTQLLSGYRKVYDWNPIPPRFWANRRPWQALRKIEAFAWPELQEIDTQLSEFIERNQLSSVGDSRFGISSEQVVEFFAAHAGAIYRKRWLLCTRNERLVLYQLAQGQLLNPRNLEAVEHLMRRGYIHRNPNFTLANESFTRFVLSAETPETFERWQYEAAQSVWSKVKRPLALVTLAVALPAIYFAWESFEQLLPLLPALLALLPALLKVFSSGRIESQPSSASSS